MFGKNTGSVQKNHLRMVLPTATTLRLVKRAAESLPKWQRLEVEAAIFLGEPPSLSTQKALQESASKILNN